MELLTRRKRGDEGFSLVETLVALTLLAIGLLSLAGVFTMSLARMTGSSWDILAKEKASETMENILAARDAGRLTFANIRNVANGGIFVAGPQALIDPGTDRLIGTADDDATKPDFVRRPGPNGNIDNGGDDEVVTLGNFTREIIITSVPPGDTLRQIQVIIRYTSHGLRRQIVMSSYVSSFTG
jgi:prepilin-type N-terminal cleavage/methylation domain-containing protein